MVGCSDGDAVDEGASRPPALPGSREPSFRQRIGVARQVGRVREDQIEAAAGDGREEVATNGLDPHPVDQGVEPDRSHGSPGDVDRGDLRRAGQGGGDGQHPAAGAQVEHARPRTRTLVFEVAGQHPGVSGRLNHSGQGDQSHGRGNPILTGRAANGHGKRLINRGIARPL